MTINLIIQYHTLLFIPIRFTFTYVPSLGSVDTLIKVSCVRYTEYRKTWKKRSPASLWLPLVKWCWWLVDCEWLPADWLPAAASELSCHLPESLTESSNQALKSSKNGGFGTSSRSSWGQSNPPSLLSFSNLLILTISVIFNTLVDTVHLCLAPVVLVSIHQ